MKQPSGAILPSYAVARSPSSRVSHIRVRHRSLPRSGTGHSSGSCRRLAQRSGQPSEAVLLMLSSHLKHPLSPIVLNLVEIFPKASLALSDTAVPPPPKCRSVQRKLRPFPRFSTPLLLHRS